MKSYPTLSELVSGIRFARAVERSGTLDCLDFDFQNEMDKAESSSHPKELEIFATNAIQHCRTSVAKTILTQVSGMSHDHPLFDEPFEMESDEDIAAYLKLIPEADILVMLRKTDTMVDKENLSDSIDLVAKLSYRSLLKFMPAAETHEVDMLSRKGLFEFAHTHFIWTRHVAKIEEYLKTTLSEKQRDDLLATVGIDICDEDYEDLLEEELAPQLILDGLESFQLDNNWIDWSGWKSKDPNLFMLEALQYAYSKLTPELIRDARESFKAE